MNKEQNTDDFFPKSMVDKYLENKSKEDIYSIKKFTELEDDNIKTILEWLIRIQLEDKKQKTLELIKEIAHKEVDCELKGYNIGKKEADKEWRDKIETVIEVNLSNNPWSEQDILLKVVKKQLLN